jgi:hypothetical protein
MMTRGVAVVHGRWSEAETHINNNTPIIFNLKQPGHYSRQAPVVPSGFLGQFTSSATSSPNPNYILFFEAIK